MPKSDILAVGLMLVGVALAYFFGGIVGASIALIAGVALLVVYYYMWRSERGDALLHVVEERPAIPGNPNTTTENTPKSRSLEDGPDVHVKCQNSTWETFLFQNEGKESAKYVYIEPFIRDGWKLVCLPEM